jgi:hypothetical protein
MRIAWLVVIAACQRSPSKLDLAPVTTNGASTDGVPWPTEPGASIAGISADHISGTVVETMGASTYTYARLEHDGQQVWIAGPETKLVAGAKIGPISGTLMKEFHSDSLNRTFPEIYFVNTFGQPVPSSHVIVGGPSGELAGTVIATIDSGGYTYAQLVDHAGEKLWLAGPATKLAVGAKMADMSGTLMTGFRSDTLRRTFDQIYFVNAFKITSASVATVTTPR